MGSAAFNQGDIVEAPHRATSGSAASDQNPERQLEQTQVSKVFTDKALGKDTQRPQLEALLSFVREGDTVVVHNMDRAGPQPR